MERRCVAVSSPSPNPTWLTYGHNKAKQAGRVELVVRVEEEQEWQGGGGAGVAGWRSSRSGRVEEEQEWQGGGAAGVAGWRSSSK
uniref:Uncharacterized protein n=1 Tax=Knipowitschia caucasica TaxID=637954 RepID=A0AAV2J4S4_KNICA